ncbi:MAG: hypothetical protein JW785_09560 [Acidimicrobiia bacterium]|nr:hypothetical protein [Acidimicrobiia bacterium]
MDLIRRGANTLAGGVRRGTPGLAALGTAVLLVGWFRRRRRPRRELLFARNLRPGETWRIRILDDADEPEAG